MLPVHILSVPDPNFFDYLRPRLDPAIRLTTGSDIPADTTILVDPRPKREHLIPALHSLIIPFAGVPEETQKLLQEFPQINIYNLHHNASVTAEMAITLMLAAARRIVPADRIFRRHDWTPRHAPMPAVFLEGKTALILGYGTVGQKVARVCQALGMVVIATKRQMTQPDDFIYPPAALPDLLPRANVVIVCLPLTPETKNLIGAAEIAALPEQAIIVNIGRAAIVEEEALYTALVNGKLHGAAFDVWYHYPPDEASRVPTPPANYPFHELDQMVMSPHRAGGVHTDAIEYARMDALAVTLNAAARGAPIPNKVDLTAGY